MLPPWPRHYRSSHRVIIQTWHHHTRVIIKQQGQSYFTPPPAPCCHQLMHCTDVFSCNEPLIMIIVSLIMMESANKLVICRLWRAPVLTRECFIGRGELANAEQVLLKCFYKLNDMFMAQRHPWSRHLMAIWWWTFCPARKYRGFDWSCWHDVDPGCWSVHKILCDSVSPGHWD